MARIIVDSRTGSGELAGMFVRALGLLHEAGINPRAGTKLVSKYAVLVVDDADTDRAIAHLCQASVSASREAA